MKLLHSGPRTAMRERPAAHGITWLTIVIVLLSTSAGTGRRSSEPSKTLVLGKHTSTGLLGLALTNAGWFGNLLNPTVSWPSCEYPIGSRLEHMFLGGIWVAAETSDGVVLVSTGADDTLGASASPATEFWPRAGDNVVELSRDPTSLHYSPRALADQQFEFSFEDIGPGSSDVDDYHVPLGVRVHARVFVFSASNVDDFVTLEFHVENTSGDELRNVYLGWYNEFTVGSTLLTPPGSDTNSWNFYDDVRGFLGPSDVPGLPRLSMMYAHDEDTDGGMVPSWIGTRMLGTDSPAPDVAYRQWRFNLGPRSDQERYAYLSSGQIDVGGTFALANNWSSLLGVGPWSVVGPGATIQFTIAIIGGTSREHLLRNSESAQTTYDRGFEPVASRTISFGELKSRF